MTKREIDKAIQQDKWESLVIEYSDKMLEDYTIDRVTFGMGKLNQIAKYRQRSLISIGEYTNIRIAIERFMF